MVRSFEYGMNFTENMFAVCPVEMVVAKLNCDVESAGK
jgi:hypothetical protein